jgi:hypothetical protein
MKKITKNIVEGGGIIGSIESHFPTLEEMLKSG